MATSSLPDPFQLWRDALTTLESQVNTLGASSVQSTEVVRSLHQFSSLWMGMQQLFEKVLDGHLRRANLPSRKDVAELMQAVGRIEDKLDRLLPADAPGAPRPARTRRPPQAVLPAVPPASVAAPLTGKPRRSARGKEG